MVYDYGHSDRTEYIFVWYTIMVTVAVNINIQAKNITRSQDEEAFICLASFF
jgi:hypothetical protein